MGNTATFFIATARSGTQWLCESLRTIYSDHLVVEHEPIGYAYSPKEYLRDPAALAKLRSKAVVRAHLDQIHEVLREKSYVEVGFPAFAAAPLVEAEFGDRLRLVQLVRHPARVAASVAAQNWFEPGKRNDIKTDIAPAPTDPGVRLRHYGQRWATMTPFEKSLFYWAEVHLYGLEVRKEFPDVPFLQLAFEHLLACNSAQKRLAAFLDVPYRSAWREAPAVRIDAFPNKTDAVVSSEVQDFPEVAALARRFGYDIGDTSVDGTDIGDTEVGDPRLNRIADIWLSPRRRVWAHRLRKGRALLVKTFDAMHLGSVARGMQQTTRTRLRKTRANKH